MLGIRIHVVEKLSNGFDISQRFVKHLHMSAIFEDRDPRIRHEAFVMLNGRRCRLVIAPGCEEYGQIQVGQHFFTLVVLQGSGCRQLARTPHQTIEVGIQFCESPLQVRRPWIRA